MMSTEKRKTRWNQQSKSNNMTAENEIEEGKKPEL